MAWITSSHHVLGIKHLLRQLWNSQSTILLAATRRERCEARHEEMKSWEGDHVHCQFPEISIQLTRKAQASCYARHCSRYQVIKIPISWSSKFQSSKADVIQGLIVNAVCFVCIFN